jgi:hypothetical protein
LVAGIEPQVPKARKAIAYTVQQQFDPVLIGDLGAHDLGLQHQPFRIRTFKRRFLPYYAEVTPEALDSLAPEERHRVYGMLGPRATITMDGTLEVSEALGEGDLFCGTETRSSTR